MKTITVRQWNNDGRWEELGEEVHEEDTQPSWEQDAARLFKRGRKFTLIASSGCSCWDGEWEGWTDITLTELRKLGEAWSKDWGGATKLMGEWIKKNYEATRKSTSRK